MPAAAMQELTVAMREGWQRDGSEVTLYFWKQAFCLIVSMTDLSDHGLMGETYPAGREREGDGLAGEAGSNGRAEESLGEHLDVMWLLGECW